MLSAQAAVAKGTTLIYPADVHTTFENAARYSHGARQIRRSDLAAARMAVCRNGSRARPQARASRPRQANQAEATAATLTIRDNTVGVIENGEFGAAADTDEHIVFDNTLYVPPLGTKNRKVEGELGKYRLNLGDDAICCTARRTRNRSAWRRRMSLASDWATTTSSGWPTASPSERASTSTEFADPAMTTRPAQVRGPRCVVRRFAQVPSAQAGRTRKKPSQAASGKRHECLLLRNLAADFATTVVRRMNTRIDERGKQ